MSLILGIDPGAHGAFAVYDTDSKRLISLERTPTWFQQVGKTKRARVDPIRLAEMFDVYAMMGVTLAVMEAVGGRAKQSASAGFVFGYGVGMMYMALVYTRIPIETVSPQSWKALLRVPGKTKADDSAILARADELFPEDRDMFRGTRGGMQIDSAEAAMLARFGADFLLPTYKKATGDLDVDSKFRNADTGA